MMVCGSKWRNGRERPMVILKCCLIGHVLSSELAAPPVQNQERRFIHGNEPNPVSVFRKYQTLVRLNLDLRIIFLCKFIVI